jgi:hypothetical protein
MKRLGCALAAILGGAVLVGCTAADEIDEADDAAQQERNFRRCSMPELPLEVIAAQEAKLDKEMPDRDEAKAPGSVTIDVHVHVITGAEGAGDIAEKMITDQIDVLNAAFSAKDGADGFDTAYRFRLASVARVPNEAWYTAGPGTTEEAEMKNALRKGGPEVLNIYLNSPGGGLLGWATFPQWYEETPMDDGVVILNESLPGGTAEPYNLGDTATHEIGHWLGLYHTFQGGCVPMGDFVMDTPRARRPNFGCPTDPQPDSCPTPEDEGGPMTVRLDPIFNFMDYTDDGCMNQFTKKQAIRMDRYWDKYRGKK